MINDEIMERVFNKMREENEAIAEARKNNIDAWDVAELFLGRCGRMLSGSKVAPEGQTIVWNANICTKTHGKIWFGDFNVTKEYDKLKELAEALGESVYVLREHDARFENELNPLFDEAVFVMFFVDNGGELKNVETK